MKTYLGLPTARFSNLWTIPPLKRASSCVDGLLDSAADFEK